MSPQSPDELPKPGTSTEEKAPEETSEEQSPQNARENPCGDQGDIPEQQPPEPIQPEAPELVKPGMDWYVLRVASNKEDQVREALERKVTVEALQEHVGRILVPTQREKRMRGGTARIYHRKMYPGYVFVEMATDADGRIPENVWFVIKETMGVGDFIGSGGKPSPMSMKDVEEMMAVALKQEQTPGLANLGFKQGDKVKVTEGPFENFEGVVDEINTQKGSVRVIVTIFGRATPVDIEYWQLESV